MIADLCETGFVDNIVTFLPNNPNYHWFVVCEGSSPISDFVTFCENQRQAYANNTVVFNQYTTLLNTLTDISCTNSTTDSSLHALLYTEQSNACGPMMYVKLILIFGWSLILFFILKK